MACVYRHIDDNGRTFYIGVSNNNKRPYDYKDRSDFWKNYSKKNGVYTEILINNISFNDALDIEMALIKFLGRRDNKTGKLVNMTDGGEGSPNTIVSKKTRNKRSKRFKGGGNPRAIKIYCGALNETFDTISMCATKLNVSQPYLSRVLKGERSDKYDLKKV